MAWGIISAFAPNALQRFPIHSGGVGVELCSLAVAQPFVTARNCSAPSATVRNWLQPFATVRNRLQPSAAVHARSLWPCLWKILRKGLFWSCHASHSCLASHSFISRGRHAPVWHSSLLHDVSTVVLCGTRNDFVTFAGDALDSLWQRQHFGIPTPLGWDFGGGRLGIVSYIFLGGSEG